MKTYDSTTDTYLSECTEPRALEMEYFGPTAKDVAMIHYTNLYETLWEHDIVNTFDFEDWLNNKTHFEYNKQDSQWESYTLDLLSEG